jgi:hypothetical protein
MTLSLGSKAPSSVADLGGTGPFWINWGLSDRPLMDVTPINNHSVDTVHANSEIELPNILAKALAGARAKPLGTRVGFRPVGLPTGTESSNLLLPHR